MKQTLLKQLIVLDLTIFAIAGLETHNSDKDHTIFCSFVSKFNSNNE